ncbi:MAG: glycoside hydrolase family 15 protein [Candidatus Dormiibacterota bacterium]
MPHVLREYALLADGERGILVGPRGDFAWLCFPRWDSPAVFASLIGGRGVYTVTPEGRNVWGGHYEPGTLIWRGRWVTEQGVIETREALALPADRGRAVVLRRIEATRGDARVRIDLDLRDDYGRRPARNLRRDEAGRWSAQTQGMHACWVGAPEATLEDDGSGGRLLSFALGLREGEHRDLVLVLAGSAAAAEPVDPGRAWRETEARWHERVPSFPRALGQRDAEHAYTVLSGLTTSGGGMVAAATTSLPERAGQGRSYDYRFVWIRDQCYAGQAVAAAGAHPLLDAAVRFVRERLLADGPDLQPAYTADGGAIPEQRPLDLPGYPGGSDLVGNWVRHQFQLDAFGESLLLLAAAGRHDHLDGEGWRAIEIAVDAITKRWREPDSGIWEIESRAWTHSRLICVAGLRAVSSLRDARGRAARWSSLADAMLADTSAHAVHPSGRWQRADDDARPDAALLLPAIRGALPPGDPRSRATLRAIEEQLTEDGYCYRFRPDERSLGQAEGAFLLCGFLMALSFHQQGETVAAARWFERNRAACGPPGLLAEEFGVSQRQLRGNLPQAFVHALLLECAVRLGAPPESAPQRWSTRGN